MIPIIGSLIDPIAKLLEQVIPDPKAAAEAKLKLAELEQAGQLETTKTQLSAIIAEANSEDPWTSRARPSFLYVIYIMLLMGIPIGILSIFSPNSAVQIAAGFKDWLSSIPDSLYQLFGVGYLGYVGGRSFDKHLKNKNKK